MSGKGREVAVVGVGYSGIYRGACPPVETLTATACLRAIDDAGLSSKDVDGIFEYQIGNESPKCLYIQRAIGCADLSAYADIMGTGPSGLAGVLAAIDSVASGTCEVALAYRSIDQHAGNTGSATGVPAAIAGGSPLHDEIVAPFGMFGVIPSMAMRMQRRKAEFGGSPEDYGLIALNARRWASMNERAVQRTLLTMDDYLASKVLCEPIRLLDCDYPVSGSCAVIVTTLERARDLKHSPVSVLAHACGTGSGDWLHGPDFLYGGTIECANRLWARSGLTPRDIDVAELYDGFTYVTLTWLEALGFCAFGEAGDWLDGGRTIGPGGKLPVNTHGGQLAEGRLHGVSFLAEAVLQLRGQCGERQVPHARTAVVATSTGPQCGGMIVSRI